MSINLLMSNVFLNREKRYISIKRNKSLVEAKVRTKLAGRLEAETTFITKVGKEGNADFIIDDFKEASINTDYILTSENEETGQAFITVTDEGQNTILVYGGANMTLNAEDVNHGEQAIREADFVVAQLEIPIEAIEQAFKIAKAHGVTTILNPAPAIDLPDSLLSLTTSLSRTKLKQNDYLEFL